MSPGMAYGELGPTHHSIEDIAWLRAIDNMTIIVPGRPDRDRGRAALGGRDRGSGVHPGQPDERAGGLRRRLRVRARQRRSPSASGDDVTIISNGTVLWRALAAAEQLAEEGSRPGSSRCRRSSRWMSRPWSPPPGRRRHRHRRGGASGRRPGRCRRRDRRPASSDPGHDPRVPEFAPTGSAGFLLDRYGHVTRGHRRTPPASSSPSDDGGGPMTTRGTG